MKKSFHFLVVATSASTLGQTGIPGLDNAIKKLERLTPALPAKVPAAEAPTEQAPQQASEQSTATPPGSNAKRDLDVGGVQLGIPLAEMQATLQTRRFHEMRSVVVATLLASAGPTCLAQDASSITKKLGEVLKAAQSNVESNKQQSQAPSPALGAGGGAEPPTSTALDTPMPAGAPTRLTGVLGIQLGSTLGAAEAQLKQRGFQKQAGDSKDKIWSKGGSPTSGVSMILDSLGRVAYITYGQTFAGGSGQFDIDDVAADLIKRFGQPIRDAKSRGMGGITRSMEFSEGDSKNKQNVVLKVTIRPTGFSLSFQWDELSFQADRVLAAREKARSDSVPKVKANVQ
jgi:hypothetical protein